MSPPVGMGEHLDSLVAAKEIVVCCGPGGVGKTTTSAALATMAAARNGGRVLVLTIDPARRLADALGLQVSGNTETRVPPEAIAAAGLRPRGELWAAMLDTRQSWDDLVRQHSRDRRSAAQILSNPLYKNVAGRFIQSHDYVAAERLYELHSRGTYDLIVVDTPPSRSALDFLEAPARMAEFFSSRLLRWLVGPSRARLVNLASRPFTQIAERVLGSAFLADVTEFFLSFQGMYDGFVKRAEAVQRLLSEPRTTFVVVTTLEGDPRREAQQLMGTLHSRGLPLGALVLNKVLPASLTAPNLGRLAEQMKERSPELAALLGTDPLLGTDTELLSSVISEVADSFLNYEVLARCEAEQRAELEGVPEIVVPVPVLGTDVYDLRGVVEVGKALLGAP